MSATTPLNMQELLAEAKKKLEELSASAKVAQEKQVSFETFEKDTRKRVEALEALHKKMADLRAGESASVPGTEAKKDFSLVRAIKGVLTGAWDDAEEKAILAEATKTAKRDDLWREKGGLLDSTNGTTGGFVVPSELTGPIIESLRTAQFLPQLGITQLTNIDMNPLPLARQTGISQALWEGETSLLKETQASFEQFNLTPHRVGSFTRISDRLMRTSLQGLEDLVRRDLLQSLAEKIDITAFTGTGLNSQPTGLLNMSGLTAVELGPDANTGGDFTFQQVLLFEGALEDANALRGNLGFAFHSKIRRFLLSERIAQFSGQTSGAYVLLPRSNEALRGFLGYPWVSATSLPTNLAKGSSGNVLTPVVFANWADFIMGWWKGITIEATRVASDGSGGSAFLQDLIMIKVVAEVDFNVRRKESFAVCEDAVTPTAV